MFNVVPLFEQKYGVTNINACCYWPH